MRLTEAVGHRPDHDRTGSEEVGDCRGRLLGVDHSAEDDHQAITLHRAERVHAGCPRGPAYLFEGVGLAALRGRAAEHHGHVAAPGPAQRARAGEQGLVGVGAEHPVDHQRLEPGVPGAADLRGPGVDLGGGEGDLAGVAEHGAHHLGRVLGLEQLLDVGLDHLDREPDQVDGLAQVDHAGQCTGRGTEDGGHHLAARGRRLVGALAVPVDETLDARLDDHGDPGPVLGAEGAEPRLVLLHARHRGRAERPGRPLQRHRSPLMRRSGRAWSHLPRLVETGFCVKPR